MTLISILFWFRSVSWLPPLLFASLVQLSSSFLDTKSQWLKVFICIFISYPNPSASLWFCYQISAKTFKRWNHQSIYHVIWVAKQLTRDRWYLLAIFGTGESLLICVIQLRILAIRLGFLIKTRTLLVWAPNHPMKIWKGVFFCWGGSGGSGSGGLQIIFTGFYFGVKEKRSRFVTYFSKWSIDLVDLFT